VTGWFHGLTSVNPDIFLEFLNKSTNTPKLGLNLFGVVVE
jgi:hypothetical protein